MVKITTPSRIKFDGGLTLLPGTTLEIEGVQKCERLLGYPLYTLIVTLGKGCQPIARIKKRENRIQGVS
jgi:hypothetical protein